MKELAPGLWFPMKLTVIQYDREATEQTKQPVVASRTETVVEQVDLSPRHDDAFFRDVAIPADLPVFTIRDRALVGSAFPQPVGGREEAAKLAEVVARVAEQERRYRDLEVEARVDYRHLNTQMDMDGVVAEEGREEHSILRAPLAYSSARSSYVTLGGERSENLRVDASDGAWTRIFSHDRSKETNQVSASLRKEGTGKPQGRRDGVPMHRPHVLMLRDDGIYGALADLLVSPWQDRINRYRIRFRYCGEEEFDGHPCIKLRGDIMTGEEDEPHNSMVLFLAVDRNLIPIKVEHYGGNFGYNKLPTGISRCDDLREIAPGTWYPFHVVEVAFDYWTPAAQGRILLNWRREFRIGSVVVSPRVDDAVFRGAVVPGGTRVQVLDENGEFLGEYEQLKDGVSSITPGRYEELRKRPGTSGAGAGAGREAGPREEKHAREPSVKSR